MKLDQGVIPVACLRSRKAIVNMENQARALAGAFGIRKIQTIDIIIWEPTSDITFLKECIYDLLSQMPCGSKRKRFVQPDLYQERWSISAVLRLVRHCACKV